MDIKPGNPDCIIIPSAELPVVERVLRYASGIVQVHRSDYLRIAEHIDKWESTNPNEPLELTTPELYYVVGTLMLAGDLQDQDAELCLEPYERSVANYY